MAQKSWINAAGQHQQPVHEEVNRQYFCRKERAFLDSLSATARQPLQPSLAALSARQPYRIPSTGESVVVTGMRRHSNLNGLKGEIKGAADSNGFLTVKLQRDDAAGKQVPYAMKVRTACVRPLQASASSPANLNALGAASNQCNQLQQRLRPMPAASGVVQGSRNVRAPGSGALGAGAREALGLTTSNAIGPTGIVVIPDPKDPSDPKSKAAQIAKAKLAEKYYEDALQWYVTEGVKRYQVGT